MNVNTDYIIGCCVATAIYRNSFDNQTSYDEVEYCVDSIIEDAQYNVDNALSEGFYTVTEKDVAMQLCDYTEDRWEG